MLKLALIAFSASLGLGTVAYFAGPVMTYSGLQPQLPFGTAIKVTPDGSNVWSWTETITKNGTYEVLVDFDKNGRMDSENKCFRVLVTDLQITFVQGDGQTVQPPGNSGIFLETDNGWTWALGKRTEGRTNVPNENFEDSDYHLCTPLVVPVGSKLRVRAQGLAPSVTHNTLITIIGRIANL